MDVASELKQKRAELFGEIEQLSSKIETLKSQISALDQVIPVYDPSYSAQNPTAGKPRRAPRRPSPLRLAGITKTEAILNVLRSAKQPISSAECTSRIAQKHELAISGPELTRLAMDISTTLSSLSKRGRVRQAGMIDGRTHLWEIAA